MHRFSDRAGSADHSRKRGRRCCLPPRCTASAPRSVDFAAQQPSLRVPLSTLHRRPHRRQRMTRGHRGSVGIEVERAHRGGTCRRSRSGLAPLHGHVSQRPPTIPDGRISRIRFWPRLSTTFLRAGLPPRRETAVLAHSSPRRRGVCAAPSPQRRPRRTPAQRLAAYPSSSPPSAQSPFAQDGCYPHWGGLESRLEERYPLVVARTGSCARPSPSQRPRFARCAPGLCRLSPAPAARWPFPTLSLRSLRRCSDPYPAALLGCTRPFLRQGHRSHPRVDGFDARISPHMAASVGTSISRLQSFDHLRAPTLARPPGCSHRSSTIATGRPGRSHHASPGRLPEPGCGVATCSTRTISMAGLSPAGSQPCRLLPTPSM
jgi:hypothetical protein